MGNRMVTWPMTSREHERSRSWPQYAYVLICRKQLEMQSLLPDSLLWGGTVGYPSDSWLLVKRHSFLLVTRGRRYTGWLKKVRIVANIAISASHEVGTNKKRIVNVDVFSAPACIIAFASMSHCELHANDSRRVAQPPELTCIHCCRVAVQFLCPYIIMMSSRIASTSRVCNLIICLVDTALT